MTVLLTQFGKRNFYIKGCFYIVLFTVLNVSYILAEQQYVCELHRGHQRYGQLELSLESGPVEGHRSVLHPRDSKNTQAERLRTVAVPKYLKNVICQSNSIAKLIVLDIID